ncbi:Chitin deacetylase [Mycena kentingensis (nom. inval.)]|nr:Chitin deacetylase [Mycena kentingensis (nom. inval.)]
MLPIRILLLATALAASSSARLVNLRARQAGSGAVVLTECVTPGHAALTYDDGPSDNLAHLLQVLHDNNAPATFFMNGNNYKCIYNSTSVADMHQALAANHQIQSHSWEHLNLTELTGQALQDQFSRFNTALNKTCGVTPTFMRPPYGAYNDETISVASEFGMTLVTWTIDTGDSTGESLATQEQAVDDAPDFSSQPIMLMHEPDEQTATELTPYAIASLRKEDYTLVTLSECLGMPAYTFVGQPQARRFDWNCR